MANPNPQHNPTDGLNTVSRIGLSAAAVALTTIVANRQYSVSLSLSGTNTTTLTAVLKDQAANVFTTGNGNAISYRSDRPAVATVTSPAGVITGVAVGQANIEARFPTFDNTDGIDFVYAQVIVTVGV